MLALCSGILAQAICTAIRPEFSVSTILFLFFFLHTTIRQKYMVLFHLIFLLYMTIRPKIRLLIDLCLLCPRNPLIEIYGPFSFIISFVHSRSNKT